MKVKEICSFLDQAVPVSFQESYDNSGLQAGNPDAEIISALLSLDVTESVLDEAISHGCNLIIAHHPLLFRPLKRITGRTSAERIVVKALKNDISIYAAHTNLDVVGKGVSCKMAEKIGLVKVRPLVPLRDKLLKLVTYVPEGHIEKVRKAVFEAGAGVTGKYDQCSYSSEGTGSFRGGKDSNPFTGKKEEMHFERELRFETVLLSHLKDGVIKALIASHPYEEVAYDIYSLGNDFFGGGMGAVGELMKELNEEEFLDTLSSVFDSKGIRYSPLSGKKIKTVALCGGAGITLLNDSISSGADVFVTGDVKYHDFFSTEERILLVDIGHYESEKFSTEILYDLIIKKFPTFALRFSEINTNPINYL